MEEGTFSLGYNNGWRHGLDRYTYWRHTEGKGRHQRGLIFNIVHYSTRSAPTSTTLIDNIISNVLKPITSLSHHQWPWCTYICINIRVNLFEPRFKLVRNEIRFDEKADFSTLPFSLDIFNSMSKSCIDTYASLCRTKITRPPAPWLNTDDIEQLQNERNELSYLT